MVMVEEALLRVRYQSSLVQWCLIMVTYAFEECSSRATLSKPPLLREFMMSRVATGVL
jgi:hypothetical protein